MSLLRSNFAHMAGGFVLMGGWAVWANSSHPMPAPLTAGLVQGVLSACITLLLKTVTERLLPRLSGAPGLVLPPLACAALSVTLLSLVHHAAGTPEIMTTLALPVTVATSYAALYNYRLRHAS
ncbi:MULTISPECIES: hypothetical protein [unclassified Roseovarius]|uniref:hypothetical protein n=1 Tax=unclassified Roseovarius TaxID=2614913 RepID=UPI00273D31EC|nr:hypothetical protein [Roseovarius sp. MMSF_3350]